MTYDICILFLDLANWNHPFHCIVIYIADINHLNNVWVSKRDRHQFYMVGYGRSSRMLRSFEYTFVTIAGEVPHLSRIVTLFKPRLCSTEKK